MGIWWKTNPRIVCASRIPPRPTGGWRAMQRKIYKFIWISASKMRRKGRRAKRERRKQQAKWDEKKAGGRRQEKGENREKMRIPGKTYPTGWKFLHEKPEIRRQSLGNYCQRQRNQIAKIFQDRNSLCDFSIVWKFASGSHTIYYCLGGSTVFRLRQLRTALGPAWDKHFVLIGNDILSCRRKSSRVGAADFPFHTNV